MPAVPAPMIATSTFRVITMLPRSHCHCDFVGQEADVTGAERHHARKARESRRSRKDAGGQAPFRGSSVVGLRAVRAATHAVPKALQLGEKVLRLRTVVP